MSVRKSIKHGKAGKPTQYPVPIPTNDLEKKVTEAFEIFDHAGNNTVDVREVGTIIRSLGCCPTEAEIQEIIINVEDPEAPGSVHLHHFLPHVVSIISEFKMQGASAEELLKAFKTLDKEGKGFLTKETVSKAFTEHGEPFSKEELDEMMTVAVDPDSNEINYEYYINHIMVRNDVYKLVPKKEVVKKQSVKSRLAELAAQAEAVKLLLADT